MQSINSTKEASTYLQRGMARCMQMSAERGKLQPSKRSQHPVISATCDGDTKPFSTPSRGAAMVSASKISSAQKEAGGFWEQGSSTQTSALSTIDMVNGEENLSFKHTPNFKTYSKNTRNITSENRAMTKFDKASLKEAQIFSPNKNSVAQLSLNRSVTLTAISAPITSKCALSLSKNSKSSLPPKGDSHLNKSFNCSPSSENASQSLSLYNSSRKLNFESNTSEKMANADSDLDMISAPFKLKKLSCTPLKADKKSSLLNGISPSKIQKAYGGPSSNPEKENVPIVKEDEEIQLQSHLLGFPNLGNTCYLNAVLQSLVSMRVFRLDVKSFVQRMPPPADSLLHGLASVLDARRTGRPSSLRRPLRLLKENFEKLDRSFIGWKMQDANEFLTKVLDTIKDEVDKLLTEEVDKSKKQMPALPLSPIHNNAPRLINNSVVVRSLSPGEAAAAYKTIGCRRGQKRSLSSESLRQNGCGSTAKNSVDSNGDTFRLVISESEESHSDCETSPPHPKVCKTSSTSIKRNSSKLKDVGSYSSFSHLTNLRPEAHNGCQKRSSAKKQSPSKKNTPSNRKSSEDKRILNKSHESDVSANPITANFGFHLQEVYTCIGCNARVLRSQEYFSLYVHLASCEAQDSRRPRSMRAAVAEYMKQEQRDLKCESCSHPTALVTTTFTKMPRILIIQMKRYTFDAAEFSSLKVCSSIEVNKQLDLSPYTGSTVSCYPSLAVDMVSAPSTPVKVPPAAHRVVGGARAEVLLSGNGEPSTAGGIGANSADVADSATAAPIDNESAEGKPLSEDEAIQEAMRRSLEDTAVVPSSGNDDSTSAIPLINVEDEETDLMKAIRLSLQEAQERERIKAAEEEAARVSAAKAAEAEHRAGTPDVPDEEDECDGAHSYRLASIVSHYGMNTTAGHYVCDAVNEKNNLWLHYDDDCVTEVPLCEVLGPSRQRNGYIFFYVHKDLLSPASQTLSP